MTATTRTLTIAVGLPTTLLTINTRRKLHWRNQALIARDQRHDAMLAAYAAMSGAIGLRGPVFPEGKVRADVVVYRRPRQKVSDDTAMWEALKPIFDGFEDAGVVTSDKQIAVGALRWHPTDPEPRIEITLTEESAE